MPTIDHDRWMTVSEAAEALGVSSRTLRRWDAEGKLSPHRHPTNGYRLYDRREVAEVAARVGAGRPFEGLFSVRREALDRLDAARARRPRVLTLFGLPGVGKSFVARAFAAERGPAVFVDAAQMAVEGLEARLRAADSEMAGAGLLVVDGVEGRDFPWGEWVDRLSATTDLLVVRRAPLGLRGERTIALRPLTRSEVEATRESLGASWSETSRALGLPRLFATRDVDRAVQETLDDVRRALPRLALHVLDDRSQLTAADRAEGLRQARRFGLLASDGTLTPLASHVIGAADDERSRRLEPPSARHWERIDHCPELGSWESEDPSTAPHRVAHWRRLGDLRRARSELVRALAYAEDSGDARILAEVWVEQGALAAAVGGEEAQAVLQAAHVMLTRCGHAEGAALALGHMARASFARRLFPEAERVAVRWHSTASELGLHRQCDDALALLQLLSYRRRGGSEALRRYVEAIDEEERHGAWWEALERRIRLVDVLVDRAELATASVHAALGRELATQLRHAAFEARFARAETLIAIDSGREASLHAVPDVHSVGPLEHARAQVAAALTLAPARWSLAEAPFEAASRAFAVAGDHESSVACHRFAVVARVLSGGRGESQRIGPSGLLATLATDAMRLAEHQPRSADVRRLHVWEALASHDVVARGFARLVLAVERRRGVSAPTVVLEDDGWRVEGQRLDLRELPTHERALSALDRGSRTIASVGTAMWPDATRKQAQARARRVLMDLERLTLGAVSLDERGQVSVAFAPTVQEGARHG